jgi:hypothetical protein
MTLGRRKRNFKHNIKIDLTAVYNGVDVSSLGIWIFGLVFVMGWCMDVIGINHNNGTSVW